LYDLEIDVSEKTDLADEHPELVNKYWEKMKQAHVPSAEFPFEAPDKAIRPRNVYLQEF